MMRIISCLHFRGSWGKQVPDAEKENYRKEDHAISGLSKTEIAEKFAVNWSRIERVLTKMQRHGLIGRGMKKLYYATPHGIQWAWQFKLISGFHVFEDAVQVRSYENQVVEAGPALVDHRTAAAPDRVIVYKNKKWA
jgi:hypothetical protein